MIDNQAQTHTNEHYFKDDTVFEKGAKFDGTIGKSFEFTAVDDYCQIIYNRSRIVGGIIFVDIQIELTKAIGNTWVSVLTYDNDIKDNNTLIFSYNQPLLTNFGTGTTLALFNDNNVRFYGLTLDRPYITIRGFMQ